MMMTDFDPASTIREQLAADEHLLWSGQPKPGIRLRASDLLLIPFSLMWGGFAIFWEWSVLTSERKAPLFFALWGIPFVLVGLYLIFGRFLWDAYARSRTHYGISNQRVLIVSMGLGTKVKSLQLRTLTDVTLNTSRDGSGSIQFGTGLAGATWLAGSGWPGAQAGPPSFELLDNAKAVYEVLRQAQRGAA